MTHKILAFSFVVIFFFGACNSRAINLLGEYKSSNPSFLERNTKYRRMFGTVGTHLIINADSTFRLKICSHTSSGKWRVEGNNLVLSNYHRVWNNDSINAANPIDNTLLKNNPKIEIFKIENNGVLTQILNGWTDGKNGKADLLIYLKKVK